MRVGIHHNEATRHLAPVEMWDAVRRGRVLGYEVDPCLERNELSGADNPLCVACACECRGRRQRGVIRSHAGMIKSGLEDLLSPLSVRSVIVHLTVGGVVNGEVFLDVDDVIRECARVDL